jgi:hypothetical protein
MKRDEGGGIHGSLLSPLCAPSGLHLISLHISKLFKARVLLVGLFEYNGEVKKVVRHLTTGVRDKTFRIRSL